MPQINLKLFAASLIWLLLTACGEAETITPTVVQPAAPTPSTRQIQARTLTAIWEAVDQNYVFSSLFETEWQAARSLYLGRVETAQDTDFPAIVEEMLAILPDDAATWQSREARIEADTAEVSSYEGIGAFITYRDRPEPHIVILSIIPDSPAESAGLLAHESILAIDGLPIDPAEGVAAVRHIRGLAGSEVTLTVRSPSGALREVEVTRSRLVATGGLVSGEIPGAEIGYMLFPPAAYQELSEDILASYQIMTEAGERQLNGLILDLRIATSGGGWPIELLLSVFAAGEVGEFYGQGELNSFDIQSQDFYDSQTVPLVVIVGPDTQGAPEIFAAILQANGRAAVVGLPTQGNVERMEEFALPDGSRIFIATGSFRVANGTDIGLAGIQPTLRVAQDWDEVTATEDPVIDEAIRYLQAVQG